MISYDSVSKCWIDENDQEFKIGMSSESNGENLNLKFNSQSEFWHWYNKSDCLYPRTYTGIGSRKTPENVLSLFKDLGRELAIMGLTLRSGGAQGADSAFEEGCNLSYGRKEIYLPWSNFNGNPSSYVGVSGRCYQITETLIPGFNYRPHAVRLLTARNLYQIMGINLDSPTNFIVCYCPGPGGTANALKMAKYFGISHIYNYYDYMNDLSQVNSMVLNYAKRKSS